MFLYDKKLRMNISEKFPMDQEQVKPGHPPHLFSIVLEVPPRATEEKYLERPSDS